MNLLNDVQTAINDLRKIYNDGILKRMNITFNDEICEITIIEKSQGAQDISFNLDGYDYQKDLFQPLNDFYDYMFNHRMNIISYYKGLPYTFIYNYFMFEDKRINFKDELVVRVEEIHDSYRIIIIDKGIEFVSTSASATKIINDFFVEIYKEHLTRGNYTHFFKEERI